MNKELIDFGEVRYHVVDVAAYCIQNYEVNCFKLQKMLYYIQAAFIVKKNRPCFMGKIVKAEFGPIIPTIANIYSAFGNHIIHLSEEDMIGDSKLIQDAEDKALIDQVCKKCEIMSGNDLSIRTHQDAPWIEADMNETITLHSILNFYNANKARLMV